MNYEFIFQERKRKVKEKGDINLIDLIKKLDEIVSSEING